MATIQQKIEAAGQIGRYLRVPITVVDGVASGTFAIPRGAVVVDIFRDTPVNIPGSPTNINLRLGSDANGQQYVADVDLKAQGFSALTLLYAIRNAAAVAPATVHFAVSRVGGTAADQDGSIVLYVEYCIVS